MVRQSRLVVICGGGAILALLYILSYNVQKHALEDWTTHNSCSKNRITADQPILVPSDDVLQAAVNASDWNRLQAIYWRYVNSVQVLCNEQRRFGEPGDGGKEICMDKPFIPGHACLVYSFGSNYQFDFEMAIYQAFGCEIHTFDPTVDLAKMAEMKPGMIQFYHIGLGGNDTITPQGWTVKTLETITRNLNHVQRTIDILKIDIEGAEWPAFRHMLQSGVIKYVKQISVEVHMRYNHEGIYFWDQLRLLRQLYEAGFKIFQFERNWVHKAFVPGVGLVTHLTEITLLNMNMANV